MDAFGCMPGSSIFSSGNRPRILKTYDFMVEATEEELQAWDEGPQDEDCPFCGAHEVKVREKRPGFPDDVFYRRLHQEDCRYIEYLNQAEERIYA